MHVFVSVYVYVCLNIFLYVCVSGCTCVYVRAHTRVFIGHETKSRVLLIKTDSGIQSCKLNFTPVKPSRLTIRKLKIVYMHHTKFRK